MIAEVMGIESCIMAVLFINFQGKLFAMCYYLEAS